jgi:peroxin-1
MPTRSERLEIMHACARKLALSELVDLDEYAELTAGFTGADLQALVYNAHLDALHASIASDEDRPGKVEADSSVEYTAFGGVPKQGKGKVLSLAEKGALDRRVRARAVHGRAGALNLLQLQTILASAAPQQTVATQTVARAKVRPGPAIYAVPLEH